VRHTHERNRTEKILHLVFENAHDALMLLAPPTWQFTLANKATLQLFGVATLNEFTSLGYWNISPEFQPDGSATLVKAQEMISIALHTGSHQFEWEHQRLDGQKFPSDVLLTRMEVDNEVFLQATVRDITEIKNNEAQVVAQYVYVAQINSQLAEMNEQLKRAHDQLFQSQKMAAIGVLASGVAHEINNPLGFIKSNVGTLEQYLADIFRLLDIYSAPEVQRGIDRQLLAELEQISHKINVGYIREDAKALIAETLQGLERVKNIVLDLKNFAHSSTDDEWVWADIIPGLDSALNLVWNELKNKCELIKEYQPLPKIYCLPAQLNQVFMNLLLNAAQAIKQHGTITLRTGQENNGVWIEIHDTGVGIPAEDIPLIFDPFFTTMAFGKGNGLGLSVSYSIVARHHGKIDVRSAAGKGTSFRVWLPVQATDSQSAT
jgi:PAS domain S-box-containing protein